MSKKVNSRSIFQTVLSNVAIQAFTAVTGILTARLLLPEGRGELAAVILWPTIFSALGIMGVNWALVREAAAQKETGDNLSRLAVVSGLILAMFTMTAGYFLIPWLLPPNKQHLVGLSRLFLLWIPIDFLVFNLISLNLGRMEWTIFNLLRLPFYVVYVAIVIGFWLARVDKVLYFIIAMLASYLVTLIFRVASQWRQLTLGRVHLADISGIIKKGLPFLGAAVSGVLAMHLDKALVVTWLSMQEVGFYSVAFTFASIHASLGQALGFSSFAALANEPDISQQGLLIAKIFRQASLLYLAAGGAVALAAPWLIAPLFGAEFSPAAKVAALLALATSLAGLANVINEALRGMGNNYPGIGAKLLGSAILALAAWLLIPHFGLLGMAEAASLGAAIQLLILVISLSWLFSLRPAELWGLRLEEFKGLLNRVAAVIHYR